MHILEILYENIFFSKLNFIHTKYIKKYRWLRKTLQKKIYKSIALKKNSKTHQNKPEVKNQSELRSVFSRTLKIKKKASNMNSPHQMKSFGSIIFHFSGLNQCQQYFSFFIVEIERSLSLLS